jgi:hypothetical protein
MTRTATEHLTNVPPITVTVGRVLYHPEAIMLGVTPAHALMPAHQAAAQQNRDTAHVRQLMCDRSRSLPDHMTGGAARRANERAALRPESNPGQGERSG